MMNDERMGIKGAKIPYDFGFHLAVVRKSGRTAVPSLETPAQGVELITGLVEVVSVVKPVDLAASVGELSPDFGDQLPGIYRF